MSDSFFCHTVSLLGILILTSVALGCTTVVAPVSHPEAMIPDQNHGLLVGAVYLDRNEANLSSGLTWPRYIKWLIEEETNGSRILLSRLPLDGPFAVKLPPGSYRITDVSLHSDQGVWYTGLPTTFRVQSGGCTNLGVWNLELKKEFRVGWLTQEVSNEQALTPADTGRTLEISGCPTVMVPLNSRGQNSIRLSLYRPDQLIRP